MSVLICFQIAVIAWVYSVKLTEPEMIFSGLMFHATNAQDRWPITKWILKPLITCVYCVAGQMALWVLILYGWLGIEQVRTVLDVLFFLSLTILIVTIVNKLLND